MPVADDGARLSSGDGNPDLNKKNSDGSHCDGDSGVHGDAQRAMVSGGFSLMKVGNLSDREERQKDKTHDSHDRQST